MTTIMYSQFRSIIYWSFISSLFFVNLFFFLKKIETIEKIEKITMLIIRKKEKKDCVCVHINFLFFFFVVVVASSTQQNKKKFHN
jgi:hypothetical protein